MEIFDYEERHVLYSDFCLMSKDEQDDLLENVKDSFNLSDDGDDEEYVEEKAYQIINDDYWDLYTEFKNVLTNGPIIIIADLGLWNGRKNGYKDLNSDKVSDCFTSIGGADYHRWFIDQYGDLRCDAYHHDGTNHCLFRAYCNGLSDEQIEDLHDLILSGELDRAEMQRLTESVGEIICKEYGWEIQS